MKYDHVGPNLLKVEKYYFSSAIATVLFQGIDILTEKREFNVKNISGL